MGSSCWQRRHQRYCHTGFETTQVRNVFTAYELRRVYEFNRMFLRAAGRLPTVDERRCIVGF